MSSISLPLLLAALIAPFALAAVLLAGLERVRGLRPAVPYSNTPGRARAVDIVLLLGGALILSAGILDREVLLVGMGLGFSGLGAAAFLPRADWRLGAQGLATALLVATFWALRRSGGQP